METPKYSFEFLETQRFLTDPLADEFVTEASKTLSRKELYLFLRGLLDEFSVKEDHPLGEKTEKYLAEITAIPEWADQTLINKGQDFFKLHGPEIALCLTTRALPSTYCCWKGATVVHDTGRLTNHSGNMDPFTRRLMETAKFVLNVSSEDGLKENGVGVFSAAKVRTLHAFIRHFLKNEDWDSENLGEPINQEDLAGTMLCFSVYVVQGLESLGIKVDKEEKEAFFHMWRVIGHLMGVAHPLTPETYEEGADLGLMILNHQKGASTKGQELTEACIEFTREQMPFGLFKFLPENIMYHQMGPELSAMVGIKKSRNIFLKGAFWLFLKVLHLLEWLKHHVGFIGKFALWLNPKILNWSIKKFLKKTNQTFTPKLIQNEVNVITRGRT